MATDTTVEAGKRNIRIQRRFRAKEGGEAESRVTPDVRFIDLKFLSLDKTITMDMDALSDEVLRQAAAFGLSTAVGNAAGQIRDDAEAFDACESRWETLQEGQWASDNKTGPRTKDLVEAWARYMSDMGHQTNAEWRERRKADLLEGRQSSDGLLGNAKVKAHYETIKFERAQERLDAATKAASQDDGQDDSLVVTD